MVALKGISSLHHRGRGLSRLDRGGAVRRRRAKEEHGVDDGGRGGR